jgi:hypothetical protein
MGIVVVKKSGTRNPATEALVVEAAAVEEEVEIEEIVHLEQENVVPQCIHVAKKAGRRVGVLRRRPLRRAVLKLQRTVDDLMGQIKVRALEARCSPIRLL